MSLVDCAQKYVKTYNVRYELTESIFYSDWESSKYMIINLNE